MNGQFSRLKDKNTEFILYGYYKTNLLVAIKIE